MRQTEDSRALLPVEVNPSLADVQVAVPTDVMEKTRLYRLGLKPELHFVGNVLIGGFSFCKETFRWDGDGDEARQQFRRGALARLSEGDVARIKKSLQTLYVRWTKHPKTGGVQGAEIVDIEAGDKDKPRRDSSRLMGNEEPLVKYVILDVVTKDPSDGRAVTAKELREAAEKDEAAEIGGEADALLDAKEAKETRKALSTTTKSTTGRAGRVE